MASVLKRPTFVVNFKFAHFATSSRSTIISSSEVHSQLFRLCHPRRGSSVATSILSDTEQPHFLQSAATGGQIFHESMRRHNVRAIFGYPGGAVLPIFDAIYQSPHFEFVLPRHEQGAGHMAQGYARATGKPGIVLVTSGPGSTNLITPIQDALMDGTPLIVFCGQVATTAIGSDAFQEADMTTMASACSKWAVTVTCVEELSQRIDEAFAIATTGRPGPVVIVLPVDVTAAQMSVHKAVRKAIPPPIVHGVTRDRNRKEQERALRKCASLINQAQKPIIFAGQGLQTSSHAVAALQRLAEKACIPVTTSLQGLGVFDEEDSKSLHMLGLHGSGFANLAIQEADVVLALGARFDDRVTGEVTKFAPAALAAAKQDRGGILHFEISPKNINKVVQATEAVIGDLDITLPMLLSQVEPIQDRKEWFGRIEKWKKQYAWPYTKLSPGDSRIKPQTVLSLLSALVEPFKERTIITTGVGQHQMWTAQYFRWRYPRTLITSGGLGTMGFGLPSAIGAKVGQPHSLVINVDGDASFCMSLNELATASAHNISVKTLLLNNNEQGMVTQLQSQYYKSRYSHTHQKNPNFVKVAQSMNVDAKRVEEPRNLEESLRWLIENPNPAMLEVMVDGKTRVMPTVPGGKGLDEFIY